jgi:hypothetical protein
VASLVEQLEDIAKAHLGAVSLLERLILQVHSALLQGQHRSPGGNDPLRHARLSAALFSTLIPTKQ